MPPKRSRSEQRPATLVEAFTRQVNAGNGDRPKKVAFELDKLAGRTLIGTIESSEEQGAWIRVYGMRLGGGKHRAFEQSCRLLWKNSKPYPRGTPVSFQIDFKSKGLRQVAVCGFRVIDCMGASRDTTALKLDFEADPGLRAYLAFPRVGRLIGPYILESVACGLSRFVSINVRASDIPLEQFLGADDALICDGFACLSAEMQEVERSTVAAAVNARPSTPVAAPMRQPLRAPDIPLTEASKPVSITRDLFWSISKEAQIESLVGDLSSPQGSKSSAQALLQKILDATRDEIRAMYGGSKVHSRSLESLVAIMEEATKEGGDPEADVQIWQRSRSAAKKLALALWKLKRGCEEKEVQQRLHDFQRMLVAVQLGLRHSSGSLVPTRPTQPTSDQLAQHSNNKLVSDVTRTDSPTAEKGIRAAKRAARSAAYRSQKAAQLSLLHAATLSCPWILVPCLEIVHGYREWIGQGALLELIHSRSTWLYYQDVWDAGLGEAWQAALGEPNQVVLVCFDAVDRTLIPLWARPYFLLSSAIIETLPEGQPWPSNLRILATCEKASHSFYLDVETCSHFAALPLESPDLELPEFLSLPELNVSTWLSEAPRELTGSAVRRKVNLSSVLSKVFPEADVSIIGHYSESLLWDWPKTYLTAGDHTGAKHNDG